jgi:uncharacterized membrane protein
MLKINHKEPLVRYNSKKKAMIEIYSSLIRAVLMVQERMSIILPNRCHLSRFFMGIYLRKAVWLEITVGRIILMQQTPVREVL